MNAKERLLAACRRQPVDRVPVWMMRQAGRALPGYRALREKHSFLELCKTPELAAEVSAEPVGALGVDAAIIFSDILVVAEAMGLALDVPDSGPVLGSFSADREGIARLREFDPERETGYVGEAIRALAAPSRQAFEITLAEAASEIAERFHIELVFDTIRDVRLSETRAEAMVRIACEAVTNAARHSGASLVRLSLKRDGQRVRLRVSDAGCGFDTNVRGGGFGLISMRERACSVGGELRVSSIPGRGSEVEAVL